MRKIILSALITFVVLGGVAYAYRSPIQDWVDAYTQEPLPEAVSYTDVQQGEVNEQVSAQLTNTVVPEAVSPAPPETRVEPEPEVVIPATFNLDVPFTSQAPFAVWDEIHDDTCEEAAILMVHRFYQGQPITDPQDADNELLAQVDYQNAEFGDFRSTNGEDTAHIAKEFYGYDRVEVVYDITIDDVKREVAQGRPVILLAQGQQLGNPYFTPPGPVYHALVVKGWTETEIIVNDPGTRRGADYRYDPEVLMNAVHDWNGGDVDNGRKVMLVMYPKK